MNKIIIFASLFTYNLQAATSSEIIILEATNARNSITNKQVVLIDNNKVLINGEKLNPSEIITHSGSFKNIAKFLVSDFTHRCFAGKFVHYYKKGNFVKEESGCINSERYNFLEKNFNQLKKDKVTE